LLRLLADRLRAESGAARVLIVGGGSLGVGAEAIVREPSFAVVESDIAFGPRTNLVCDAHDLPFEDGTFDAVIAQAVLEYAFDPFRVASEIHRVLRPRGWVYAESPFMQQVHGGAFDFFRFSHVGHRRIFERFDEVESGIACGPAMAFGWSYRYLLRAVARGSTSRALLSAVATRSVRGLLRCDRALAGRAAAYDAASAFYFLGQRSEIARSPREILDSYRGTWKMRG
ncbi:MAG: methyltransferase domain-containing protein, partial [Polyangiaceae bacterium]